MQTTQVSTKARLLRTALLAAVLLCIVGLIVSPTDIPAAVGRDDHDACLANEILFVAADRPLPEIDEPLWLYLIALGQRVTVRSAAEVTSDDAKAKALVIISESVESSQVNTKFREVAVPIVTWEGWLQDDLGMTAAGTTVASNPTDATDKDEGAYGETLGQTRIRVINAAHPLAGGYSGIVATVDNRFNKFHWGVPNANAILVAQAINNAGHTMIYAYEQGAAMVGLTAPARRVFLHNASGPNLTTAGLSLFLNAVYWAMGCLDEPLPPTVTPTATTVATAIRTDTPTATATSTPIATATSAMAATPTATNQPATVIFSVEKSDLLFNDADWNGEASQGDTILYTIRLKNSGDTAIHDLLLEDQLDINTRLVTGSVRNSLGVIEQGNRSGDDYLLVRIDALAPQTTAEISFQAQINLISNVAALVNQATVRFSAGNDSPAGQQQRTSNDPDTPAPNDATLTPLGSTPFQPLYLPLITR